MSLAEAANLVSSALPTILHLQEYQSIMDRDAAEVLAINAIGFLAADPDRMEAFLSLAGVAPSQLRSELSSPELLAGVLDHLLQNESLLLDFCAEQRIDPATPAKARRKLPGATLDH